MKTIGIIGAMEVEVAILKEKMEDVRIIKKASMDFYEGALAGRKDVVVCFGFVLYFRRILFVFIKIRDIIDRMIIFLVIRSI